MFAAACLLHGLLLTIPVARQAVVGTEASPTVSVRLQVPETEPGKPDPVPRSIEIPPLVPPEPVELAELPEPEPPPAETQPPAPAVSASRILLELEEKRRADPLAALRKEEPNRPDYYTRYRPALEEVLNTPSLQLPFEDKRIYLVDHYESGWMGGVDRFFDEVTVPFGFTTKNNTRVQCAWTLTIIGCGWGDVSYYYARDRAKKRK